MNSIPDMFVRIVNAGRVRKANVALPHSKLKAEILKLLYEKGYVGEVAKRGKKNRRFLDVPLMYHENEPLIKGVKMISKSSRRMYGGWRDLVRLNKRGVFILSTPQGLLMSGDALKKKIGGEIIAQIL